MTTVAPPKDPKDRTTPARTLVLAVVCLALPLLALGIVPEWVEGPGTLLVWLPALVPAFLLAYHRGWNGASVALAGGMATLVLSQVEILILDLPPPSWGAIFGLVLLLVVVAVGTGWLADLLGREREAAVTMALTDPLTGIPNRRYAMLFLEAAWAAARRGQPLALVLLDVDHFKRVNDDHGHASGDAVLRVLGEVLSTRVRGMDLCARVGGEEFLCILANCEVEAATTFAEEVRGRLAEAQFPWGNVTASAGVAAYEDGMGAHDVLLAAADRALYAAKQAGRDRTRRADQLDAEEARGSRPKPEVPTPTPPSQELKDLTVLLVDDDRASLRATSRTLEGLGCRVEAFANPFDAIRRVQSLEIAPHVLITDVVMPEMSGFALVDMLARLVSGLPVLYISGYDQRDMYWSGAPGARSALLGKPFTAADLTRELLALVGVAEAPLERPIPARAEAPHRGLRPSPSERLTQSEADPASELPTGREGRILIVDDDASFLRSIERIFVQDGYRHCQATHDPRKAIEIAQAWHPDLVIVDIHMPGVDGLSLMSQLHEIVLKDEFIPVIVISGDVDPTMRRKALELGATDFLRKPLDVTEALARVRNVIRTRFLHQKVMKHRNELEKTVSERTWELADTRTEILHRLARAAEYRDDVTGRHAARVGLLSALIAAELGMPAEDRELIRRTAPLHDLGKVGIPDHILHKKGALSDDEFAIMKRHTTIGAKILEGGRHRILRMARDIAESHHERWDGKGYPHGLAGDEIPIEARIVAAADTFDAFTHMRPYKGAKTPREAVEEIVLCRGTHFDADVANAIAAISARVGPEALPNLVDPVDPLRDTEPAEGGGWLG